MFGVFGPRVILCFASQEEPEPMDLYNIGPQICFLQLHFYFLFIFTYPGEGRGGKRRRRRGGL